jgi:hypothetical protein
MRHTPIRFIAAGALVIGFLGGLVLPLPGRGNATTGDAITIYMQPPTLGWGSSPYLTCGRHSTCLPPYNTSSALDWDDNNTGYGNPVYYRSYNFTSNTGGIIQVARGLPLQIQTAQDGCAIMAVWVAEGTNGPLRAIPKYDHVNVYNAAAFPIWGRAYPQTQYTSRRVGSTVNDSALCSTTGSHVHEDYYSSSASYTQNTAYPTASGCHDNCGTRLNSNVNNYTRRFQWTEGY